MTISAGLKLLEADTAHRGSVPHVQAGLTLNLTLTTDPLSVYAAAWKNPVDLAAMFARQMLDPVFGQVAERLLYHIPGVGSLSGWRPGQVEQFVFELRARKEIG